MQEVYPVNSNRVSFQKKPKCQKRNICEIQEHINDGTIMNLILNDAIITCSSGKINIEFPRWLDSLDPKSKNIIITRVIEVAPSALKEVCPGVNVVSIERNTQD
jgi:hypothetical protein